ncbi:cyclophilin-like domain-containing protein [Cytidiella melzeri]|nr:cyclophilin-like domain-containing protein [Cytidiella melzeri]
MARPRVFFDVAVDGNSVGRVVFELYSDTAPTTCENFRALCTGEKGLSALSERPLYYKNSIIHRSIKDFMIQGGDFAKRNGSGGESIYGGTFADEDLTRPLDAEGLLCMANKGPNTNGSQFFVTLRACPHLNGKHVVFGRVIRGYQEVIQKIAEVPADEKDRPGVPVTIANCGELMMRSKVQDIPDKVKKEERHVQGESHSETARKHTKRRHKHRSRSRSGEESGEEEQSGRRHHHKQNRRKRDRPQSPARPQDGENSEKETEEQYDSRLEREEKERLEAQRIKELERLKRMRGDVPPTNGVRFKGRGRMKFIDPELRRD